MRFKQWLESDEDDRAELYFSIGHGDYNDEHGIEPEYIVWAIIGGSVQTARDTTHGAKWGHDVTDNVYKGRYEPETGRLSIVSPARMSGRSIPTTVMDLLHSKFDYITKVYEF